jgi:hypothetical protein
MNSSAKAPDTVQPLELISHVPPQPVPFRTQIARQCRDLLKIDRTPKRVYYFSDTFGGTQESWNPLAQPDYDVLMTTDFRARPTQSVHRDADTFGHEKITDHFLRLALTLHDELASRTDLSRRSKRDALRQGTGIFVNFAPRTDHRNASPFWIATARGGQIRVVATPLESLSAIKEEIEALAYLPNPQNGDPDNGLYGHTQQFRSSYTPRLLNPDHRLEVVEADPSVIPDAAGDWHVSFVDRYGNVITHVHSPEAQWKQIETAAEAMGDTRDRVRLCIGNASPAVFRLGTSLGAAEPGELTVYGNGNIDLANKWAPHYTPDDKLQQSAFVRTGRPTIGTPVRIAE